MEVCFCSCVERTTGNKTCNLSSFVVMKFVVTGVTTSVSNLPVTLPMLPLPVIYR